METFTMSRKEVPRAGLAKAALAGRITNEQGARALHMSLRQFRRVTKRFREGGARGLLHALRGRPGNRHLPPQAREQIATLITTTYAGSNDVHLTEKLREGHPCPPPWRTLMPPSEGSHETLGRETSSCRAW